MAWSLKPGAELGERAHFSGHRVNRAYPFLKGWHYWRVCEVRTPTTAPGQSEIKQKLPSIRPCSLSTEPSVAWPPNSQLPPKTLSEGEGDWYELPSFYQN